MKTLDQLISEALIVPDIAGLDTVPAREQVSVPEPEACKNLGECAVKEALQRELRLVQAQNMTINVRPLRPRFLARQ